MNITLVVPTKNRLFFIKRLLKYYLDLKFRGKILVVDSSDDIIFNQLSDIIKVYQRLKIIHIKSKLYTLAAINENLSYINTDFASFLGDDDYLIPNGIAECIQHLKKNNDIAATQGSGLMIGTPDFNRVPHITQANQGPYSAPLRLEKKASERFIKHYLDYNTPFFAVWRSEIFKKFLGYSSLEELSKNCPDGVIAEELLQSSLAFIFGRFDRIKDLHVIRCMHSNRQPDMKYFWEHTSEEDRQKSVKFFSEKISAAINESENLPKEHLENTARDCVNSFIKETINYKKTKKISNKVSTNNSIFVILKKGIKKVLAFFSLLEFVSELKRNIFHRKKLTIENLLKKENIYHKDFIYVYNSILYHYNYEDK